MPLVVGRGRSIRALDKAEAGDGTLLIVAQRVLTAGDPDVSDLHRVGTLCKIESMVATDGGSRHIVVTGIARIRVLEYRMEKAEKKPGTSEVDESVTYVTARGEIAPDVPETAEQEGAPRAIRNEALFANLKEISREVLQLLPGATEPLVKLIDRVDDPAYLTNVCAAYLSLSLAQKQELLEAVRVETRMNMLLEHMRKEREVLMLQREIRDKMSERLNKAQRDAILREQMRTIRTELGDEPGEEDTDELEERIREAGLPPEAEKLAREELRRLRALPPAAAEHHVIRSYLELLAALPWRKRTESKIDIARARHILDEDHYGLDLVKKRILQYLAVAKLKNDLHGPILCLVGPPGVGKTSLGQSIARAMGRKFIRTSLGGVRDEAEIRGHRRTYVGAMPGRIIQSLKRVGVRNPVMMLDEIDKLRSDVHGDPSSAMLEVLDPEQNSTFVDHYLDTAFDLSDVFFVATANVIDTIPGPLRDRMEIIEVSSYTTLEKLEIAKRYLVPKQLREHGLQSEWVTLPESTLDILVSHYTREAGVRELQRKIAALFRAAAEEVVEKSGAGRELPIATESITPVQLAPERLEQILGPERYLPELAEKTLKPGVAMGLAWTPHGGEILFVEATSVPSEHPKLTLTGSLGDVMKESAQIALTLARGMTLGEQSRFGDLSRRDLHVHVPSGAIPKDGPSAGVTILAALASLLSGRPLLPSLAMTGEITLRGNVLPVGGVKEKVLAAHRAGVRALLVPKRNRQDLLEVPESVKQELRIEFVETVEDVLAKALEEAPVVAALVPSSPISNIQPAA